VAIPDNPSARLSGQAESLRLVWPGYRVVARRQGPVALCAVRSADTGGRRRDGATVKMPFGKYRDWPLAAVPLSYLAYALENWELEPEMRLAMATELRRRVALLCPGCNGHGEAGRLREAIEATRRALAVRYHPDRHNGDHALMRAVNEFAATLLQRLPAEDWTPEEAA